MIKLNCQKEKSTKEKDILTNFLFPYAIYYYLIIPMHDQQSSASMDSDT